MKGLHMVSFILLVIGGLNWLLVAFSFNLVTALFGNWPWLENLVYILVGISAIYEIAIHKKVCKMCTSGTSSGSTMGGMQK